MVVVAHNYTEGPSHWRQQLTGCRCFAVVEIDNCQSPLSFVGIDYNTCVTLPSVFTIESFWGCTRGGCTSQRTTWGTNKLHVNTTRSRCYWRPYCGVYKMAVCNISIKTKNRSIFDAHDDTHVCLAVYRRVTWLWFESNNSVTINFENFNKWMQWLLKTFISP